MGRYAGDGGIEAKISLMAKNLKTEDAKCALVNLLAGSLLQNKKKVRDRDVKGLKEMAILAQNFNSPTLKCAFADLLAQIHNENEDGKLQNVKSGKVNDTDAWPQCDVCGAKIKYKRNLKKHFMTHTKKATPKPADIKNAKDSTSKVKILREKKHTDTAKNTKQKASMSSDSYKCAFCDTVCKAGDLYKHYGLDHNIDCPEEILFNGGNVLVYSDRDTESGEAAWFKEQRKKFKDRYKVGACKFCDSLETDLDMLNHHYLGDKSMCGHNVDPSCLEAINHLFRADKNAHLKASKRGTSKVQDENTSGPRKKTEKKIMKRKLQDVKKPSVKEDQTAKRSRIHSLMYVCECGVATENYDSTVEHSQRHLVNCTSVTQTCDKCEFKFEAACYADHASRHETDEINHDYYIQVKYDYAQLQSSHWFNAFKDLSDKDQIEKSIYKYTRNVKLNTESNTGMPVYQCAKCRLCIDPKKVEQHCNNSSSCVKRKGFGHKCRECHLIFKFENIFKAHKEDHKKGPSRLIVFNNQDDDSFNRALLKLEHERAKNMTPNNTTRVEGTVKKPEIEVISAIVIEKDQEAGIERLCNKCNKFVDVKEFGAHSAIHEAEENSRRMRDQGTFVVNVAEPDNQTEAAEYDAKDDQDTYEYNEEQDSDTICPNDVHEHIVVNTQINLGEKHQEAIAKAKENHGEEEKSMREREDQEILVDNLAEPNDQNEAAENDAQDQNTYENIGQQDSTDTDSCPSVVHEDIVVHAQIHEGEKHQETKSRANPEEEPTICRFCHESTLEFTMHILFECKNLMDKRKIHLGSHIIHRKQIENIVAQKIWEFLSSTRI